MLMIAYENSLYSSYVIATDVLSVNLYVCLSVIF